MSELIYRLSVLGTVLVVGLTLRHAWGDGERLAFFGTSVAYGFLLEKIAVVLFGMHSYPPGQFLLYLWDVPVTVPLVWGVIVYASLIAGRHLGLGRGHLPVFAGLYVLHIDLAIDAIAIRVPFWTWHLPGTWFDVPVVNFVGWYSVAFLFTGFFLYLQQRVESHVLAGLASLTISVSVLIIILEVWLEFVSPSAVVETVAFGAVIVTSLGYLSRGEIRPGPHLDRFPMETFISVLLIHLFYLQTILYYGYHRESPILLYTSVAMLLVGIGVHYPPRAMRSKTRFVYRFTRRRIGSSLFRR